MSFNNFLKTFNEFLLEQGGTTYLAIDHYLKGKDKPLKSVFFSPYSSASNFLYRASHVVTAPISFSIITIELVASSLYLSLKSLNNLVFSDKNAAKIRIIDSIVHFAVSLITAIGVIVSPIVNLIDLIGGAISTMRVKSETAEQMKPSVL
ncbi:hypothetical protein [Legionella pneumophila]|uniref:Integral membrane protein n=1 Tax=Legionella pneumophila subsp. pascullei TaxID=91890 RepID=A0AAX2IXW4_LEGPN|nr:hypothetical protein [Legionella pneumophila]AMP88980.1 hypothetical protein AXF35_04465 [Legionella pneumophila subsp. pascullei]AMP93352.1 hypothetical protein AXF36_12325 [Legionella pneumophila subsp. pascullei]AMP96318.1 hypothetical protein AXF37_12215 [Legionella pneumophila subsp. pascullei]SQG91285.1 putative integral membrane protein [Legionella pneumophila subsp. pascullei]VEH07831.1 putative integral membrane protein [Legionella pneumophila subsp. pascullei]